MVGISPRDLGLKLYQPAGVDLKDELSEFAKKSFSFETNAVTPIEAAYKAYYDFYNFDDDSVRMGDALSRHKFTRWVLYLYCDYIEEKVVRYQGKVTRCFSGMRLRSLEELVEE